MCAGGNVRVGCANKNNLVAVVSETSICKNSICCSSLTTERGVITDVINPLLSFANASFLNPSARSQMYQSLSLSL